MGVKVNMKRMTQMCHLLYLFALSHYLKAAPLVNEVIKTYVVHARGLDALRAVLDKSTLVKVNGKTFYAFTDTYVRWHYWWNETKTSCAINKVSTAVDVTYTMPELNENLASLETRHVWKKYYASLILHEKGHADIAIEAALAIEKSLLNMPSSRNCRLLSQQANSRAEKVLEGYRPQHKVYDRETDHGYTQGAYLDF